MKQIKIEEILKRNFVSCDAEECWNACSDSDKYGYIDVAIVFNHTHEIQELIGDHLSFNADECWLWAIAKSKGGRGLKYSLADMDSGPTIDGRTNLAKAIKHLFDEKIKKAKKDLFKELEKENRDGK